MKCVAIIDKPAGWTSHDVVAKLRVALKVKRVGHSGTLDPMATGVLPVFIGGATKAVELFEGADKEYIAGLRLGLVTDTQDITGTALRECEASVSAEELSQVLSCFIGAQKQIPPMFSAIKIGGKKLYELARQGVVVERPARDIFIAGIELLEGGGNEFLLKVNCSKGTYIRTLCHDIGAMIGCGGTMSSLRRTRAGAFAIDMAHKLDDVLGAAASGSIDSVVVPIDSVFSEYQAVTLGDADTRRCINGAPCYIQGSPDGVFRFYGPDKEFLLLGEIKGGELSVIKSFYGS